MSIIKNSNYKLLSIFLCFALYIIPNKLIGQIAQDSLKMKISGSFQIIEQVRGNRSTHNITIGEITSCEENYGEITIKGRICCYNGAKDFGLYVDTNNKTGHLMISGLGTYTLGDPYATISLHGLSEDQLVTVEFNKTDNFDNKPGIWVVEGGSISIDVKRIY